MLFTPIILSCLVANPTQCRPILGVSETTEAACMVSLAAGIDYMTDNRPDLYAAGLVCLETHFLDQEALGQ